MKPLQRSLWQYAVEDAVQRLAKVVNRLPCQASVVFFCRLLSLHHD